MSKSLVDELLAEDTTGTETIITNEGAAPANTDAELPLDEEMAMRRMASALSALDNDAVVGVLQEQNIIVHLNRQSKTNNLANRQALLLAKAKGDPLYAKYARANGIRLQIRELIHRKYGAKAISRARQLMSGTAVQPMAKK
jgi:hypothetical protein